jgi:NAD(P)-dependent dehydrogenase (short-subunit alcohol dehydrogenase family)
MLIKDLFVESTPGEPDVDLTGKKMLVTGGSRGVGAEVARIAAGRGADVAVNYRNKARRAEQVADKVREHGREALIVQADITDEASVASMYEELRSEFGGLDILVLNASGGLEKDVDDDYAMRLNRDSQVALVKGALPLMSRGGVVVFVTSHLAHYHGEKEVMPEYEPVAASKKAGEVELRAMLPDLEQSGIRLAVVSGDLIDGTITPKLLDRMRPGTISQRRDDAGWLPTTEDFAASIVLAAGRNDLDSGASVYVGSTDW